MNSVTMTHDSTTITLPAPLLDGKFFDGRRQSRGMSADGTAYVYDSGLTTFRVAQTFSGITASQKTALSEFFHEVNAQAEQFVYTDEEDETYNARFARDALTFIRRAPDIWNVELELELEPAEES